MQSDKFLPQVSLLTSLFWSSILYASPRFQPWVGNYWNCFGL